MGTKINVQVQVLSQLSGEYRKYGDRVSQTYNTASSQMERELESIARKYADYSSVTSQVYELQSQLRKTAHTVRVLHDRSEDLSRGLRHAADEYIAQQKREEELINRQQASGNFFVNVGNKVKYSVGLAAQQVESSIDWIGKKVDTVYTETTEAISDAADWVQTNISEVQEGVQPTVVSIGQNVKNAWDHTVEGITVMAKKTRDAVSDLAVKITDLVDKTTDAIVVGAQQLIDWIAENKTKILDGLKKVGIFVLDSVQFGLDLAGLIPIYGEIADGVNALIYLLRKDYVNAGLSLAACIPFAGWAATGGKIGSKILNVVRKVDILKVIDKAKDVGTVVVKYGGEAISFVTKKAQDVWTWIKQVDVFQRAEDLISAISKKGYEIQAKIVGHLDNLTISFNQWWDRQAQMGIVPPGWGDIFGPKKIDPKKPDVDINVEPKKVDVGTGKKTGKLKLSDFTEEIMATKPKYARIPEKWYAKGGHISIDEKGVWTYTNKNGVSVSYPNGYPNFSMYYHPDVKPVKIEYAQPRNYPKDYEAANTEAGLSKTSNPSVPEKNKPPEGYTWHHMEDGKTMVLVEKDVHDEFKHMGGQSIVNGIGGD